MSAPTSPHSLIEQLRRATGSRRLSLADRLARMAERPEERIDARTHRSIAEALGATGPQLGPWRPPELRRGETYLLTFTSRGDTGDAAFLRARRPSSSPSAPMGDQAREAVRSARDGLIATLRARGLAAPGDRELWELDLDVTSSDTTGQIEGPSIGLSAAISILSYWTGRPPSSRVAASAAVTSAGRLEPIGGLASKVGALRARWPQVQVLVVAQDQTEGLEDLGELTIHRAATLAEVIPVFGLGLEAHVLPKASPRELERIVEGFRFDNEEPTPRHLWGYRAEHAADIAAALGPGSFAAARAKGWAALFALHAGDASRAKTLIDAIDSETVGGLAPCARAWLYLTRATTEIDLDPGAAVRLAEHAQVELSNTPEREVRRELLGRARGTLGRALMHTGRFEEALVHLEEAALHHARELPSEEPRSRSYQAAALRLLGRPEDALLVARGALDTAAGTRGAEGSIPYLEVELGRAALALARYDEAIAAFLRVGERLARDDDYPRISALRGLAAAYRRSGRPEQGAAMLHRCLQVARNSDLIGQIAARAAGDALDDANRGLTVTGLTPSVELDDLRTTWEDHFGAPHPSTQWPDVY